MFTARYETLLVVTSILVAILASYTALDMAGRINSSSKKTASLWLAGGAFAMGIGVWSMHFIGMLAFRLPIALGYDLGITFLSLLIAVTASGFALWRINQAHLTMKVWASSAVIMGTAIAAMHYTGMAAMRMSPGIQYDPLLFAVSILIAIAASGAALWIAVALRHNTPNVRRARAGASVVMGIAIVGMHYTGMAAANFPDNSICRAAVEGVGPGWLAIVVAVVTLAVLAIALLTSVLDARLESQTARLVQSLEQANQELSQLALQDSLTKLPNRSLLEDRVDQAIHKANRKNSRFALLFLDLDGFKAVNDSLGHHTGDQLLIEVGQRLRRSLREQDTVARLGGDEFVVLLDAADPDDAAPVADKLVRLFDTPFQIDSNTLSLSTSIGVAIYPEDGNTRQDLLRHADAAMYHTKAAGRNGYHFFEAAMDSNAHKQLALIQDLRTALERGEFRLHYQAKFDAKNGHIAGAEALLRWVHPERGMVAPDVFIPVAEKTGMILSIGAWVMDEACRQMRLWHDAGHPDWKIAVNLSAQQFRDERLQELVLSTLQRHHLPAQNLILEVTESTAMHDVTASLHTLHQLAAHGIQISIDDFGTGYSSLLYLKRMPANELKIDRGFINDLEQGSNDVAIVTAIVALGNSLGLRIVAEGVETEKQKDFLVSLGCNDLQGYLLGRPVPPDQFITAAELVPA